MHFMTAHIITSVTLPSTVTEIGQYVFERCYNLKGVILNEGLQKIGLWAFHTAAHHYQVSNFPLLVTGYGTEGE